MIHPAPSARAKRRDRQHEPVQAVVEVGPKRPVLDSPREVPVRRRDDPHVQAPRLGRSDRPHLAALQEPEQHDLGVERQVADLIQEHGAAIGDREQAALSRDRARECPALVPEQLAQQQLARERPAVHRRQANAVTGASCLTLYS